MAYEYGYYPYQSIRLFKDLGTRIEASRPFSRFNRLNAAVDIDHIIESIIEDVSDNFYEQEYQQRHVESFTTVIPRVKYVWDNTLWSFMHPVAGSRYYLQYRTSPGINKKSLTFHSITADGRKYFSLFNGVSVAGRFFGGTNWGLDAQKFRLGGIPCIFPNECYYGRFTDDEISVEELYFSEYVMPIRGIQRSNKLGVNVLLANIEFRLPFLIYYFPAIKYLGQINGVIFTDFGVAWNTKYPAFWDECSWESSSVGNNACENNEKEEYAGWLMSYGFGPRFIFLGFPWQLDFAWQYNPHKGTISDRQWYLTIGLDF